MKYIHLYILFVMLAFCTSCGQNRTNSPKENIKSKTINIVNSPRSNDPNIHTQYEYVDSLGKRMIIQNGFPRGMRYTDANGEVYMYGLFWTRIINETDNPLELKIDFPVDSYEDPYLPGKYLKILVPPDTMTLDKEHLFNYGLIDLASFLDRSIHKPSSLKRSIHPKESSGFYVVLLSLVSDAKPKVTGIMRTGLILKGGSLFYRISRFTSTPALSLINEKEIPCGSINLKNLTLQK